MTPRILSKSGDSLADIYNVEGSIAGIEMLRTEELPIVHEMGHTVFSERFGCTVRRANTGNIAQSVTWDILLTDLPPQITRIFGVAVFCNTAGRVANCAVSANDALNGRELPIYTWNSTPDDEFLCRIQDNGAAAANHYLLRPFSPMSNLPGMLTGTDQWVQGRVDTIAFRGNTAAFGAGTVNVTMVLQIGFTAATVSGLSSRGLPIPGW